MKPLSRKQREIAEREELVLTVARTMLREHGYLGVTMDKIASATEYSKGTIYQHFSCKEEIMATLATRSAEERASLFERAATFQGRPRERLSAVGVAMDLFVQLYPQHFETEKLLETTSIFEKTSESRQNAWEACDFRCMNVVAGLIRDAIATGDLETTDEELPLQVTFGLWSLASGTYGLLSSPNEAIDEKMGFDDPVRVLHRNYHALLDGYGLRPFYADWDWSATYERIRGEVFATEIARAESA